MPPHRPAAGVVRAAAPEVVTLRGTRGRVSMKTARTLRCTLRMLSVAAGLALATGLVGCDDENDPATWVKRLDDPAQRANAIKRLTQFYEDDMTRASNNASAPEIKSLL